MAYEAALVAQVRQFGKLLLMLFLCVREHRTRAQTPPTVMVQDHSYTLRPAEPRNLSTMFGTDPLLAQLPARQRRVGLSPAGCRAGSDVRPTEQEPFVYGQPAGDDAQLCQGVLRRSAGFWAARPPRK